MLIELFLLFLLLVVSAIVDWIYLRRISPLTIGLAVAIVFFVAMISVMISARAERRNMFREWGRDYAVDTHIYRTKVSTPQSDA